MSSEEKNDDAKAIIPEDKHTLATRSPALISRGLRDLTGSLDSVLVGMGMALRLGRFKEEVIGEMIERAHEIFRSEAYYLFLMDSRNGELFRSPLMGSSIARQDFNYDSYPNIKVGEGGGLAGWVARTGQLAVVPDISKDSRFLAEVDGMGTTETRSIVAAPVCRNDLCLGVIELINCVGSEGFSKRKLTLLEALADFAAIAIENSHLNMEIHILGFTDAHSGLDNARLLHLRLDWNISESLSGRVEFSLILIDLELHLSETGQSPWKDFREVPVGAWESCVKKVGQTLRASCGPTDSAYRYTDTKFAILLSGPAEHPGETKEKARRIACDLRRQFGKAEWLSYYATRSSMLDQIGRTFNLPACIGVVSFPKNATTKGELLKLAEEMISLVRNSGRAGVAAAGEGIL
jgi:GGDEF domain-containing protein/putative methionine-R-sulfoxide reductase with GAF domain